MHIRYGFCLGLDVPQPTAVLARLDLHPERRVDILEQQDLTVGGASAPHPTVDAHGNLCRRLLVPAGHALLTLSGVASDSGNHEAQLSNEALCAVADLPQEALLYLVGSRYCEVDSLGGLAWNVFGSLPEDARRVRAVVDYVHEHISFGYVHARPTRTAAEALVERVGVCRDFAHATIALCRALNIPARYVNGYLGDIGVPKDPAPMDFSAWVEVFVGDRWFTVDARHNTPRIGRLVVARGRDAADVPLIHSFGPHTLREFTVTTDACAPPHLSTMRARQAA